MPILRRRKHTKEELKMLEQVHKDLQEKFESATLPLRSVAQRISEVTKFVHDIQQPLYVPFIPPPPRPATTAEIVELLENHSKARRPRISSTDKELIYSQEEQYLSRFIGDKKLIYEFRKGKRFSLFDLLYAFDGYVPTNTIKRELGCPTDDAVYKLVEGFNNQAKIALAIKYKLIEGREGFGYRINKNLNIIPEN